MIYVIVSEDADEALKRLIEDMGRRVSEFRRRETVYPAIAAHPDIFICKLGGSADDPVFEGTPAGAEYPGCASLCACCTDELFIHNLRITDRCLLEKAVKLGKQTIHVNQGFTRCSLLPVGGRAFITSDVGICRSLASEGVTDVLTVSPGHIQLPGHEFGFIGGCAGRVGDSVVFNGDLTAHPDHAAIERFIADHGLKTEYIPGRPLTDIGSIIETDFPVS